MSSETNVSKNKLLFNTHIVLQILSSDANYNKRKLRSGYASGVGRFGCHGYEESLDDCPKGECFSYYAVEISCQEGERYIANTLPYNSFSFRTKHEPAS